MRLCDLGQSVLWLAGLAGAATAQADVATRFEFTNTSGEFRLGNSPNTASFLGGRSQSVGNPALYHSGSHSWMVLAGTDARVLLETEAEVVSFFFRNESANVASTATLLDSAGNVLQNVQGNAAQWTQVRHVASTGDHAVEVRISNAGGGIAAVDDFVYTGRVFGPQVSDPIPDPIVQSGAPIRLEIVATGLTAPNWGTSAPGVPDTLFVSDQGGFLYAINTVSGARRTFLRVRKDLVPLGIFGPFTFDERGLLGVTFHPDYAANGKLYTYTSEPLTVPADFTTQPSGIRADHQSVVKEWTVPDPSDPGAVVDQDSGRVLMRIDQPQFNHDGGALAFGPDGLLYIALGDGGGADDRDGQNFIGGPIRGHGFGGNGQDTSNVLGSILRIDVDGSDSANGQYGIPADNPFVGTDGVDEIYCYGLRNPFRISFDQQSGDLYIADVGQNDLEEIHIGEKGANFGWNHKEGSFFFVHNGHMNGFVTDVDPGVPSGLVDPIAEYDHDEGVAIIGGFVYRGDLVPALDGTYVFGDFRDPMTGQEGRLFFLEGSTVREFVLDGQTGLDAFLLGFAQDSDGEVYVLGNTTGVPFGTTGIVLRITQP